MIDVPTRVKDALRENNLLKNYRFNVLNDDTVDFTIDNNNLKSEKVCFDERLASGDVLKFGLCEGTSLEFQYFGLPDINGRRIQAFIDVQYKDAEGQKQWYTIPMGFYTVKKCPMQFSTGIRKVTAYNKLMSDYLDAKANKLLIESYSGDTSTVKTLYDIQNKLLNNYAIVEAPHGLVDISQAHDGSYSGNIKLGDSRQYTFKAAANVDTPLSTYGVFGYEPPNIPDNIGFAYNSRVMVKSLYKKIEMDALKYWSIDFIKGNIEAFANTLLDYMTDLIYDAQIYHAESPYARATHEEIREGLKDFHMAFGINIFIDGVSHAFSLFNNPLEVLESIKNLDNSKAATIYISVPIEIGADAGSNGIVHYIVTMNAPYQYSYIQGSEETGYEVITKTRNPNIHDAEGDLYTARVEDYFSVTYHNLTDAEKTTFTIGDMPDFTLRELMSADYELSCRYGKLDRQTDLFSGIELNNTTLYPQDTLYPEDTLYPSGTKERTIKSSYSQLWTDDGGVQSFKYLIITYQGLDENNQKVDYTLQRTINTHGTTNYNLSDNWLFKNLVWTSEQIGAYADAMVEKMRNIRWFPFEMWASGLPYLETGDEIEIVDRQGQTHTSYVLKRTLEGIQNLQDTYENGIVDVF